MSATLKPIKATVEPDGTVRLLEPVSLKGPTSAIVTLLLEDDEDEISEEWRSEIRRRVQEVDEGKVTLVDGEAFLQELEKDLSS